MHIGCVWRLHLVSQYVIKTVTLQIKLHMGGLNTIKLACRTVQLNLSHQVHSSETVKKPC